METTLAISLTLCHQFESEFYNTKELKICISKATEIAEDLLNEDVNIVFEDIEEVMTDSLIHSNVINSIRKAHVIIFELSDVNPNVLYELGVANGLKKPIIILREKTCTTKLPTDINQFIYLVYEKNKLNRFHNKLAEKIKYAIEKYDEINFISKSLKDKILEDYVKNNPEVIFNKLSNENLFKSLKTKNDFSNIFKKLLNETEINMYYIGTLGFLSKEDKWFKYYIDNFNNEKVFSRIVYIQTLEEFYKEYDDIDMLVDYCIWLAINYYLVREKILIISNSKDISIWKHGISFIVSDEKKLLISTGSFSNIYNNKGFYIENTEIARMFKEYSKILSIKSKIIRSRDFANYFSIQESQNINKVPQMIEVALNNINDDNGFKKLKEACNNYIVESLDS